MVIFAQKSANRLINSASFISASISFVRKATYLSCESCLKFLFATRLGFTLGRDFIGGRQRRWLGTVMFIALSWNQIHLT